VIHYVAQYLHPGSCQAQQPFFHAMIDAESDASCQAPRPQNNPQPSAPHQLPQPSEVRSCNPSDVKNVSESWYVNELSELLMEALDEPESAGDRTVTWKKHDKGGHITSVLTCVPRARSRSPHRQVGEPQAAANPHAESHTGLAPADGKAGKD
jgi:hypothetical protein